MWLNTAIQPVDTGSAALTTGAAGITASGEGAALTIEEIGGVALDLDAAEQTPGDLATIEDTSGNNRDFTSTSTPNASATGGPNDAPHIRFESGEYGSLGGSALAGLTAADFFAVWKFDNETSDVGGGRNSPAYLSGSASNDLWTYSDGQLYSGLARTERSARGNPSQSMAAWHVGRVTSTATEWSLYAGAEQVFTTGTNTVGFPATCVVGAGAVGSGASMIGDIALLVIFDHKLSATDLAHFKANILRKRFGAIPGAS